MKQNSAALSAAGAYRKASATVAPLTAIVLLYDKIIVLLQQSALAGEQGRPQDSFGHLVQATTILRGLSHGLDFQLGGHVAERLRTMYTQTGLALMHSYGRPDMSARFRTIAAGLTELRDAWAELARRPPGTDGAVVPAGRAG
jgi:flagellar protein FliS